MKCLLHAWQKHENELRHWLNARLHNPADTDDLLQIIFEKAILQGEKFCNLKNPRAWLFQVAKNTFIDRYRTQHEEVTLPDDLSLDIEASDAVESLSECIPRILSELSKEDCEVITLCDLDGISQQEYAKMKKISLSGAKSRIQRARQRMRQRLQDGCQIQHDKQGNVCCFVPRPPL